MWNCRVDQAVNSHTAAEKSANESVLQLSGSRTREVRMHIVGAEATAVGAQIAGILRLRRCTDNYRVRLVSDIHQPYKFGSVRTFVQHSFIRHNCQSAAK